MALTLEPIPLLKPGEEGKILSTEWQNRLRATVNALWNIQGSNGVIVTKSQQNVVINIPGYVPTVCIPVTPAFDFMAFKQWIVIFGSVDLLGPGFNDILPGSGYYVDMAGTTVSTSGWIRTRDNINLTGADTYVLEWQFAGNQRGAQSDEVQVIIRDLTNGGTLFDQTYALTYLTGWTSYTASVTPVADTAISIEFRNPAPSPNSNPAGMLLRGISFRNDTTGESILTDEFGCEAVDNIEGGLDGPVFDIVVYANGASNSGVYLVGAFSSLNGVQLYNIAKLVPFQGNTVVSWSYTFTVGFSSSATQIFSIERIGNNLMTLTGEWDWLGQSNTLDKIPDGYDLVDGAGNFMVTDTVGVQALCTAGPNNGFPYPIQTDHYDDSAKYGSDTLQNNTLHAALLREDIFAETVAPYHFGKLVSGYNRLVSIGFGDPDNLTTPYWLLSPIAMMSHDKNGDNYGWVSECWGRNLDISARKVPFPATGICTIEGTLALATLVDRLGDPVGVPPTFPVIEANVINTGFIVTYRGGIDYWHPCPGAVAGFTWYDFDEANPPTRGVCLVDWRLAAGQVMPENIGFPVVNFPYWTGAGASCACYSPVFSGARSGEFIVVANNTVIDGGTTDWNGARAADFRGMFALLPDGTAKPSFAVNLTFTGLSAGGDADDYFNHPEILFIDSSDRIWFTGPIATINGTAVTAWQLYYIDGDGSGGTQVGFFGGGKIWSFREFAPDQFIVGGEFTNYLDPNANDTGAQYLLFIDSAGAQITLTW